VASSLEKLQKEYPIDLHWRSFMLRPPGSPPIPPQYRARIESSRPMLAQRAREQYGVEINPGPFDTNSRPALIAEKFAEAQGKGNAFHDAVMHAYWQEARAIDDQQVLQEIANSIGLTTDNLSAILQAPQYEAAVNADIMQAQEYGLDAVPALVFADKYLVSGAQPYEVLKRVIEKVQEEEA
jgi:predicted DsbA family dithiol-disulfide isomerase